MLLSLFKRRERGEYPPVALADNCRQTPPNPVRLAKGSSSNKKSGGGELRGEVIWLKVEILRFGRPWNFGLGFTVGTKERDGEREERGGEMIVCLVGICGLATSWVCRAMNDKDLLKLFERRRAGFKLAKLSFRFRLMICGLCVCSSNGTTFSS